METTLITKNGIPMAVVTGEETFINDTQSALDFIMTVREDTGVERIVLIKNCFAEDFFILSTGIAGEILQKFINYHVKAAVYGDYSGYTSKPLRDFIYESNHGRDLFFVTTREEALDRLTDPRL